MNATKKHTEPLKRLLLDLGFKQRQNLWYQFLWDYYMVTSLEIDSYGYLIYSITNLKHDDKVFRGRFIDDETFMKVLSQVVDDISLMDVGGKIILQTEGEIIPDFTLNEDITDLLDDIIHDNSKYIILSEHFYKRLINNSTSFHVTDYNDLPVLVNKTKEAKDIEII